MEPLSQTINQLSQTGWVPKQDECKSKSDELMAKARALITRMWTSSNREIPEDPAWIEEMSREAIRLWSKIPLEMWGRAVSEAIIQSGAFPATIGLVAKVWKERQAEIMANAEVEAHKEMRRENSRRYLGLPSPENRPPSGDEINQNLEEFRRIRRSLGDLT